MFDQQQQQPQSEIDWYRSQLQKQLGSQNQPQQSPFGGMASGMFGILPGMAMGGQGGAGLLGMMGGGLGQLGGMFNGNKRALWDE